MRSLRLVGPVALLLLLAACGVRQTSAGTGRSEDSNVDGPYAEGGPPIDPSIWKNPLGDDGVEVSGVNAANLVYSPDVPTNGAGDPASIVATKASETEPEYRKIAWVYDDATYGPFFVQEEVAEAAAAQSELEAMGTATPGCTPITPEEPEEGVTTGTRCISEGFSLVKIRDAINALLIEGPQVTSVTWVVPVSASGPSALDSFKDPGLLIAVVGPSSTFKADFAIEVANKV